MQAADSNKSGYRVALIPGDGIGKEVVPQGVKVLEALAAAHGFALELKEYPFSCEYYLKHKEWLPAGALEELAGFDAILLGAVGDPSVADHVSLWGLLMPLRRGFEQYVNLRPVRLLPGVPCPLAGRRPEDIDFIVVRENTEGEYSEIGGRLFSGTEREMAVQESVFTKLGVDRIMRFAYELAASRPQKHLSSATKSNGIIHSMPYWDERFASLGREYPQVGADQFHIDILTANFVLHPDWFDVVVGSNLFGDILSDLGPAVAGGIGIAPSANLNPEKQYPSMFEPVHGSAPDIAGKGIANPIATLWSVQMMLDFLGQPRAAASLMSAIEKTAAAGILTADLGGTANTDEVARAVLERL